MTGEARWVPTPFAGRDGLRRIEATARRYAVLVLVVALAAHVALLVFVPNTANMVDLRVYQDGSPALLAGQLWDFRLHFGDDVFPLPFTYPPFAALVMLPLAWLPFPVLALGWHAASIAALWFVVRRSLGQVSAADPTVLRQRALLWTAATLWLEPVRTTFNYGQVNLLLAAVVLAALTARHAWLGGLGVGAAAGIKLIPAVSGLYFLLTRRWAAAAASAGWFLGTVALTWAVAPGESREYWLHLLGDASRIGPVGSAINQSLRGALSRTVGYDVGSGPVWLVAAALAVLLTGAALRAAVRHGDTLATIVGVQFLGLLVSPVSWSHHWVWVVPALVWLVHGPARARAASVAAALAWVLFGYSYLVSFLLKAQPTIWTIPRTGWLAVLGWAYPVGGVLVLGAIWLGLRERRPEVAQPTQDDEPAQGTLSAR